MFNNFFRNNETSSKTGFFKVDNGKLIALNEIPGNGSINSYIESLGFATNHVHTIMPFKSVKINTLGFKILTKELVFVLAESPRTKLSFSEVQNEISLIDWNNEYSSLNIEEILQDGIEMENIDLKFLMTAVDLTEEGKNLYKAEKLGLYLQFDNNILTAFTSSSWDNSATKWLFKLNPRLVHNMTNEAKQYHSNDMDSMEEVNKQANSLLGIPGGVENEFIPLHIKPNGNVSFYNLLVTHYKRNECNKDEFLFMNMGRYRKLNNNTIEVGNFIYSFNNSGQFESVVRK